MFFIIKLRMASSVCFIVVFAAGAGAGGDGVRDQFNALCNYFIWKGVEF